MDQLTVFTTVLGYTDPLHEPPSNSKARFICFTDCDIQSKGWQLVKIEPQKAPKRLSKQIKALSHLYLHTEWSLWIDCCFDCLVPPESLVGYGEFVTFKHKDRSNVYDESRAVIKLKKAKAETVKRQMRIYTSAGFPVQSTLPNGGRWTAPLACAASSTGKCRNAAAFREVLSAAGTGRYQQRR